VCNERYAYVGMYHATLLRHWVHVGDCGWEPSIPVDASVESCNHAALPLSDRCTYWLLLTSPESEPAGRRRRICKLIFPKFTWQAYSRNSAKKNPVTEHLTPIVCIRFDGNLDDSKSMKTDSGMLQSCLRLRDLPFHFFGIICTSVLLDVSCRTIAAPQLKRRVWLMLVRNVGSVITTPWPVFMTFLDTILLHLTSVENFCRVFPARKVHQQKPAYRRTWGTSQTWEGH